MSLILKEDEDDLIARLQKAQNDDEDTKKIIRLTQKAHSISRRLLFKEVDVRLVILRATSSQVFGRAHERGHFSVAKTEAIVKRDYHVQNLRGKTEKLICNCIDCNCIDISYLTA